MDPRITFLLSSFYKHLPGASEANIKDVQDKMGFAFPSVYVELLKNFNGGEGRVGGSGELLILFSIDELIEAKKNYEWLMDQIPDYFLFGTSAADTGYAFHKKNGSICSFGLMSDFKTDPMRFCGNDFMEFLEYMYNSV